jgi:outer membrane protein assembly complex protein YaeT
MFSLQSSGARLLAALLLGFTASALGAQTLPDTAAVFLQHIVAVRIVEEPGGVFAENPSSLPLQPGGVLDRDTVRESVRQLYATGRYADIRAEVFPLSGGVRVDFLVRPNFFISEVRVEGLREPPSDAQALGALRLRLGETFRDRDLEKGLERLSAVLRADGFYGAVFDPVLTRNPQTRLIGVSVRVEPGLRAHIGEVRATNPTIYPTEQLLRASRLHRGKPLTAARLDHAADLVRRWLFRRGHLGSRVAAHPGEYNSANNTVPVDLDIAAGPVVRVEATGAKLSQGKLKKLVPVFQEGSVDEDLLAEGRRNIRDYFERRGYFNCEAQYATRTDPASGVETVSYSIHTGPQRRLVAVEFSGDKYFSPELLRARLTIYSAGFLKRSLFSERLLRQDEDSLRSLYVTNGFAGVQVHSSVVEKYGGHANALLVRFKIEEGPQTLVESLDIEGNRVIPTATLLSVAGSRPGQPYSEADLASDRDNILVLYLNTGMPDVQFDSRTEPGSAPNRVKVKYRIVEGPEITVAQVVIGGYQHTRLNVIRRRILIQPGEPLRQGDIVESQRELYNLGVFNRVAIAPENPQGVETSKTMLVDVEEGKRFTFGYGGGIEVQRLENSNNPTATSLSFSPRGILEFSWANVGGLGHTLQIRARASTLQGRGLIDYSAPRIFGFRNWNLQLSALADKTRDVRTFTSTRYEASVQFEHRISPVTTFLYRYTFRHVLASNLQIAPQEIPLFSQPTKVSGPSIAWVRDARDNPADPTKGRFYTVDVRLSARKLGSTADFLGLFAQNSSFTPLGHHLVFARSTRFGIETPYGPSSSTDIPLPERFFAGGGTSLRGFGLNQAGPRDTTTGFPVGGLALLVSNQELRFPLRVPFTTAPVGGAIFYDVGDVYSSLRRITLRYTPPPNDLNFLSHSVGFGVRYATPVGPIRFDLGYLLNPPRFTLPTAPGGTARLGRFQFFLNFGTAF